jgi:shikimate dehydrogenase
MGESASVIGAVNCAVLRKGKFIGENTDGKGFLASLQTVVYPVGKEVIIFGAGGAARAIAVEVALAGAKRITIVNRDLNKGVELVALLNEKTQTNADFVDWSQSFHIPSSADVVVNATSIGMYPNVKEKLNIKVDSLLPKMVVADVVINPAETQLLKDAAAIGCTVLNGSGMIVNQAVLSIKFWTDIDVNPTVVSAKLHELI